MSEASMNIIKYQNRKLYDLEKSRYVTLAEVMTFIKEGGEISARSKKNNEDITNEVLKRCFLLKNVDTKELLSLIRG